MPHRKANSLLAIVLPVAACALVLNACESCGPELVADSGEHVVIVDAGCSCDAGAPVDAAHPDTRLADRAADATRTDTAVAPDTTGTDRATSDVASADHVAVDQVVTPDATSLDHPLVVEDLVGIYDLTGSDPIYGAFTGQAEIRPAATTGAFDVIHLVDWTDASFENLHIAQAWQGQLTSTSAPFALAAALKSVNYIAAYGGLTRDPSDTAPHLLQAALQRGAAGALDVNFSQETSSTPLHWQESWTWRRAPAAEPIWKNERRTVPAHEPPPDDVKSALFTAYQSYHALEYVAPYVDRAEFQAAIHGYVVDPTDFDYYRADRNRVRVIQSVVDPISLAEARVRRSAYGHTLAEKQALFDAAAPVRHVNAAGYIGDWLWLDASSGLFLDSGDSQEWTGMYIASQSLRYLVTHEPVALDNVKRSLDGQFISIDITGQPGEFARALRPHVVDGNPDWVPGAPPYEAWDWLQGGNNDMQHGLTIGFLFGEIALRESGGDAVRQAHIERLTHALLDSDNPVINDNSTTELAWNLLAYFLDGGLTERLRFEALFAATELFLIDQGNGVQNQYGAMVDASGIHLCLLRLFEGTVITERLADDHLADFRRGLRRQIEIMRSHRLGLLDLVAGTLGDFASRPPEVDDAIWRLREYQVPKVDVAIEHRLDPDFCMSPYPYLPWKGDWTVNDRSRGLHGYPLFENNMDQTYEWKRNPFDYRSGASPVEGANVDFLVAYWFARFYGVIDASM